MPHLRLVQVAEASLLHRCVDVNTNPAPTLPVVIGVAQVSGAQSTSEGARSPSDPIELMAQALQRAAGDSAGQGVLDEIGLTAVVGGLWRYPNPAALVARELGIHARRTMLTDFGGQVPMELFADLADRIQCGDLDVAVILGGECNATRRALARLGQRPSAHDEPVDKPDEFWGEPLIMGDEAASGRGADQPRNTYAVLDSAIRAARGESLDQARDRGARICASYSAAAETNLDAAVRRRMSPEEIREPSSANRMVSWPYTKAMCANNTVDHAGAIIMCSSAAADRLRVPVDKRVYAHAGSLGADTPTLAERLDVASAPGLRATCAALVDAVGSIDAVAHLDLYCCFPSMVTLTAEALGVDLDRPLTIGGGLGMAGAPINFAAGEGLIAMVHRLRSDPTSLGIVQANGGHASKHAFGLLSTSVPDAPYRVLRNPKPEVTRAVAAADTVGPARVDGITVEYTSGRPTRAVALVRFDNGSRTWANSHDAGVMRSIIETEWVGRRADVNDGLFVGA